MWPKIKIFFPGNKSPIHYLWKHSKVKDNEKQVNKANCLENIEVYLKQ